jgi:hypothetical protein
MSQIKEPKNYQGQELETIFFRPMLTGDNARDLGVRVLYNMPVPTTLGFWRGASDVLKPYTAGWSGGASSRKFQKQIDLRKVKSEMGYSAADYFTMIWEKIAARPEVNFQDLSGTQLEEAETELFRASLAESIRATMWIGNIERTGGPFNTFDGFLTHLFYDMASHNPQIESPTISTDEYDATDAGEAMLKKVWDAASIQLKGLKSEGQLAFFVTSDIYAKYEEALDGVTLEAAYIARQEGRPSLSWRGIPVVDMKVSGYLSEIADARKTWIVLTDRRNLALAVNTADFPGAEVQMWYNADEMQNRHRAVFAACCDYLFPELVCFASKN